MHIMSTNHLYNTNILRYILEHHIYTTRDIMRMPWNIGNKKQNMKAKNKIINIK